MRKITKTAVLGAGVMGAAIAAHLANSGLEVLLLDRLPSELDAEDSNRNLLADQALQKLLKTRPAALFTAEQSQRIATGNFEDDLAGLNGCDWVIEAVIEDLDVKAQLFARIAPHLGQNSILSTNTSGIPINLLAEHLPDEIQKRFLLTHFFNPPRYMQLLEVVPCRATDPGILSGMTEFLSRQLGKGVVLGKDTPNFIGNRIGVFALFNAMYHMRDLGLQVDEVDAVAGQATARPKSAVFRTADMVGLDTLVQVGRHSWKALPADEQRSVFQIPAFLEEMVESGRLGDKSGQGFYCKQKNDKGLQRQVFDLAARQYRPVRKVDFPCLQAVSQDDGPGARIRQILTGNDPGAEFAWRNLRDTLIYACNRVPEIADGIEQIDRAMRWGFNWEIGPFEIFDAIGVADFVRRADADGVEVPESLRKVAHFYKLQKGEQQVFDLAAGGGFRSLVSSPDELDLEILKSAGSRVDGNDDCSVHDLGDGVFGLEFHSKLNSISPETLAMIIKAVEIAEKQGAGLLIGNQGPVFSAGANLAVLAAALGGGRFEEIGRVVALFQKASMTLKYAQVPVVTAPFNLALGGACEFCLHSAAIVAHAETYMGLVEVGVGILPAGGGSKELALRAIDLGEQYQTDVSPFLFKAFENIGMAKVSASADELFSMGYLRHGDNITMNRARLLGDAKQQVLALAGSFRAKCRSRQVKAPGQGVAASIRSRLWNLARGGFISEYDVTIGSAVAGVLCGGDVPAGTQITEAYLLELEREAFLSLIGNRRTIDRIEHMLKTGKPLRN